MSIDLKFLDTWQLFLDSIRYDILISIIISSLLLCFICIVNKQVSKYLIIIVDIILLFFIGKYYVKDILTFSFNDPINNIYFYFFNGIIFITIYTLEAIFDYIEKYDYIFYALFLILMSFSLFMSDYLDSSLVIYNIYPMIKIGNIIMLLYYIVVLTKLGYHVIIKKTSKRSGRL